MRISIGDINTVAATIQQVEGWYPGSISYRNNNPGNLRPVANLDALPSQRHLETSAPFPRTPDGYNALLNQLNLDASRGLTISQEMQKYAPASDGNNPSGYAATIASQSGLTVNDLLSTAIGPSGSNPLPSSDGSDSPASYDPFGSYTDTASLDFSDPTTLAVLGVIGITALALFLD